MKRAVFVAASCLLLAGCGGSGDAQQTSAPSSTPAATSAGKLSEEARAETAYSTCVDAVEDRLKAPATAEFAPLEEVKLTKDSGNYTIIGDVDSENGFGALIRNTYTCQVFVASNGVGAAGATVTFDRS